MISKMTEAQLWGAFDSADMRFPHVSKVLRNDLIEAAHLLDDNYHMFICDYANGSPTEPNLIRSQWNKRHQDCCRFIVLSLY